MGRYSGVVAGELVDSDTLEVVNMGMVETWGNTPGTGTQGNDGDPREKGND